MLVQCLEDVPGCDVGEERASMAGNGTSACCKIIWAVLGHVYASYTALHAAYNAMYHVGEDAHTNSRRCQAAAPEGPCGTILYTISESVAGYMYQGSDLICT